MYFDESGFISHKGRLSGWAPAGQKPKITTTDGTSDARFVQKYCPIIEFGLVSKTIHQIDEYSEISDIKTLTEIYLQILADYFT